MGAKEKALEYLKRTVIVVPRDRIDFGEVHTAWDVDTALNIALSEQKKVLRARLVQSLPYSHGDVPAEIALVYFEFRDAIEKVFEEVFDDKEEEKEDEENKLKRMKGNNVNNI